jgi:hypothetical protein
VGANVRTAEIVDGDESIGRTLFNLLRAIGKGRGYSPQDEKFLNLNVIRLCMCDSRLRMPGHEWFRGLGPSFSQIEYRHLHQRAREHSLEHAVQIHSGNITPKMEPIPSRL